jgi:hypothetical protein
MKTIKKIIYYFTTILLFPIILICGLLGLAAYGLFYMLDSLFEWANI